MISGSLLMTPALVSAQAADLDEFFGTLSTLIANVILVIAGLIVLALFWGIAKYVLNAGDEEAKKQARDIMVASVIGLTVALSIWVIVTFLQEGLFGDDNAALNPGDVQRLIPTPTT